MRITKVEVNNFKGIDGGYEFDGQELLVGPNGTGKTGLLQAIQFGCTATTGLGDKFEAALPLFGPRGGSVSITLNDGFSWCRSLVYDPKEAKTSQRLTIAGRETKNLKEADALIREKIGSFAIMFDLGAFTALSDEAKKNTVLSLCAAARGGSGSGLDHADICERIVLGFIADRLGEGTVQVAAESKFGQADVSKLSPSDRRLLSEYLVPKLSEQERGSLLMLQKEINTEIKTTTDLTECVAAALNKAKELANSTRREHDEKVQAARELSAQKATLTVVSDTVEKLAERHKDLQTQREDLIGQVENQKGRQTARTSLEENLRRLDAELDGARTSLADLEARRVEGEPDALALEQQATQIEASNPDPVDESERYANAVMVANKASVELAAQRRALKERIGSLTSERELLLQSRSAAVTTTTDADELERQAERALFECPEAAYDRESRDKQIDVLRADVHQLDRLVVERTGDVARLQERLKNAQAQHAAAQNDPWVRASRIVDSISNSQFAPADLPKWDELAQLIYAQSRTTSQRAIDLHDACSSLGVDIANEEKSLASATKSLEQKRAELEWLKKQHADGLAVFLQTKQNREYAVAKATELRTLAAETKLKDIELKIVGFEHTLSRLTQEQAQADVTLGSAEREKAEYAATYASAKAVYASAMKQAADLRAQAKDLRWRKQQHDNAIAALKLSIEGKQAGRVETERRLNDLLSAGGDIPIETLTQQQASVTQALNEVAQQIRAKQAWQVLEQQLAECTANAEAAQVLHDTAKAVCDAIRTLRESLMTELVAPLLDSINRFLAIAAPGRSAHCALENDRGKSCFELGWSDGMARRPMVALSGGEQVIFGAGLAYALVRLANVNLRLLMLEVAEVDHEHFSALLDGLAAVSGDVGNCIIATCHEGEIAADGWGVISLAAREAESAVAA